MSPSPTEEELITRLLALPAADRMAALDAACALDPALHARRPAILAAINATAAPSSIGQAVDAFAAALAIRDDEASGVQIGPYKLLQKIGEGGFGVVWMAEQQAPIRRRVAVKIIKVGMDTEEVIARFEAERQALALMEHPNIARVFDAGATAAGRPYFVMELVRGVAITRYCDDNKLSAGARLRLFITVCHAVQHAHQKGVIHRDLKPSNILVTLHDGVPVPKIIDFGIAKATSTRLTEKTLFTQFHAFIGTPAYTSPEQMEMSGLDVDTRSDIYSLGVLLYELLTSQLPFDSEALAKSGLEAMRRTIREIDPPRPSHRLSTLPEVNRTSIAQQRGTDSAKLSLLLRGDLDWIAMRCLEKDRTRRYASANALAADIERHLNDDIVDARPPTQLYRMRKFVRRHQLAVAATAAVVASLVAGLVASSALFVRERSVRARAEKAEQAETHLRQQAEAAREGEARRVSRATLALANQLLSEGKTGDALAYFLHAARKDPANRTIPPRLLSVLTSRNFFLPQTAPTQYGSPVVGLHFSPDGRTLFVGTADGVLRTFDAASGDLRRELRLEKPVRPEGWIFPSGNDSLVAVGFTDNTLLTYDLASGLPSSEPIDLRDLNSIALVTAGVGFRFTVKLSPDGRWLGAIAQNNVRIWDLATGKSHLELPVGVFDFSPDGTRLAMATNSVFQLWALPEAKLAGPEFPLKLRRRDQWVIPRFSSDGGQLIVCNPWEGIHVFDAVTGSKVRSLPPWTDLMAFGSIGFSPDGRVFVSGSQLAGLWNVETGQLQNLPIQAPQLVFREKMFDSTGRFLLVITVDGFIRLWDTRTGELHAEPILHRQNKFEAALSPDGHQLVIGTAAGVLHRLKVSRGVARPLVLPRPMTTAMIPMEFMPGSPSRLRWFGGQTAATFEVASGHKVGEFSLPGTPVMIAGPGIHRSVRPDRKYVVVNNGAGQLEAWNLRDGMAARVVPLEGAAVHPDGLAFSPTEEKVAVVGENFRGVALWDLRTGKRVGPPLTTDQVRASRFPSLRFSPDGRQLIAGMTDGRIMRWETTSGRLEHELPATSRLLTTGFNADGSRFVTTHADEIQLYDSATGRPAGPIARFRDPCEAFFSPDGRKLVSFSPVALRFWDAATMTPLGESISLTAPRSGSFSTDSARFVVAEETGAARVWDVQTGQPVTEPLRRGSARLPSAVFSPDGKFVRVETTVTDYQIWSVPPPLPSGVALPEWLTKLVTVCSGKRVTDDGELVEAPEAFATIEEIRRELAALPETAPYVEWGRWILNDRADRSIAPGFILTPAEADALAASLTAPAVLQP